MAAQFVADVKGFPDRACYLIEMGPHPVLTTNAKDALESLDIHVIDAASSMRRGQPSAFWLSEAERLGSALALRQVTIEDGSNMASRGNCASTLSHEGEHLQNMVMKTVRKLTNRSSVDPTMPLMQAGLSSIAAEEFASELHNQTGLHVSPTLIFEHSTVAAIADHLSRKLVAKGCSTTSNASIDYLQVATSQRGDVAEKRLRLHNCVGRWPAGARGSGGFLWCRGLGSARVGAGRPRSGTSGSSTTAGRRTSG